VHKKSHKPQEDNEQTEISPVEEVETVDPLTELKGQLAAKEIEAAANWDKYLRERADLENYRKRTQREKEELINTATRHLCWRYSRQWIIWSGRLNTWTRKVRTRSLSV